MEGHIRGTDLSGIGTYLLSGDEYTETAGASSTGGAFEKPGAGY